MKRELNQFIELSKWFLLLTALLLTIFTGLYGIYYTLTRDVLVVIVFIVCSGLLKIGYNALKDVVRKLR